MVAAVGLFEDDRVRVLDGRVAPGSTVPVHTHRWGGVVYILATSEFRTLTVELEDGFGTIPI
jgi:predicted metal-dependent enzyme (double-stranded beta helix superfamily)